ncbi:MAG: rhamnulokinase, partial [Rubrobacter sp.]|nr:rhamnulokinase [Rubrobacter sp.]
MTEEATYLAIDIGAESGRALLGRFDGERVVLEEVHRFPNVPVRVTDGLHWDALRLMGCVYRSLSKAARKAEQLESMGIDSWGVDFALLDREGALVSNPYHHRDPRTEGMIERAFEKAP